MKVVELERENLGCEVDMSMAEIDREKSTKRLKKYVWPVMKKHWYPNGELLVGEELQQELPQLLDQSAGLDALIDINDGRRVVGVASRVQWNWNKGSWDSFTIRSQRDSGVPTEYEKRIRGIEEGGIYPEITVQAYGQGEKLLTVAKCRTEDLYEFIKRCPHLVDKRRARNDPKGKARFKIVWWKTFGKFYDIDIVDLREKPKQKSRHPKGIMEVFG